MATAPVSTHNDGEQITADVTAEEGGLYLIDTTSAAITVTIPKGVNRCIIRDYGDVFNDTFLLSIDAGTDQITYGHEKLGIEIQL